MYNGGGPFSGCFPTHHPHVCSDLWLKGDVWITFAAMAGSAPLKRISGKSKDPGVVKSILKKKKHEKKDQAKDKKEQKSSKVDKKQAEKELEMSLKREMEKKRKLQQKTKEQKVEKKEKVANMEKGRNQPKGGKKNPEGKGTTEKEKKMKITEDKTGKKEKGKVVETGDEEHVKRKQKTPVDYAKKNSKPVKYFPCKRKEVEEMFKTPEGKHCRAPSASSSTRSTRSIKAWRSICRNISKHILFSFLFVSFPFLTHFFSIPFNILFPFDHSIFYSSCTFC